MSISVTFHARLNDPVVNKILGRAERGTAGRKAWITLDHKVMSDAVYLPMIFGATMYYRNPRMTNVTCDNAIGFGIYDFVNVGVRR